MVPQHPFPGELVGYPYWLVLTGDRPSRSHACGPRFGPLIAGVPRPPTGLGRLTADTLPGLTARWRD